MARISTYANASPVTLSDMVIGTSVGATPANATKNFLVSDLLALFDAQFSLQEVLDTGNTATQNLTLTGTLGVTGEITHSGGYSYGGGQFTMAATGNMVLGGTLTCNSSISLTGTVKDYNDTLGTDGKILVSNASGEVTWQDNAGAYKSVNNLDVAISSYELTLSDANGVVVSTNASPVTIDIPSNTSTAFPIGTRITIIQEGSGQVTVQGLPGATLNASGGKKKSASLWAVMDLVKTRENLWYIYGERVL
tara:strand:- start:601 stop:1353 length:753 start_codon:yes stop_codon:yes gene_type:complete